MASATVKGRFAARLGKTWSAFTDSRNGETVNAGQSLKLFVVEDDDGSLSEVKVKQVDVGRALAETSELQFGDQVEFAVKVDQYGTHYVSRRDATALRSAPKPAA